jgi:diguanylate cyclase (GGDEF)-like protein/PAS domain S-box-containing protein
METANDRAELMVRMGVLKPGAEREINPAGSQSVPGAVWPALLSLVAESSADVISVHRPGGEYVYVSPNCERWFGWTPSDLSARSLFDLVHPDDAAAAREHAGSPVRYRLRTAGDDYRWVESRAQDAGDGQYLVAITRDVQAQREMEAELERVARYDPLTGMLNRRGLDELLEHEIDRHRRYGSPLTVMLFDVDDFKAINDTMGPDTGDETLRDVGRLLEEQKRNTDYAGRWGGDEFLAILPETGAEQAVVLAQRLGLSAQARLGIKLSLGVASAGTADTIRELVRRADAALYAVKMRGGNGVEFYCAPTL